MSDYPGNPAYTTEPASPPCQQGKVCETYFTCGRKHDFPNVDHGHDDCELDYLDCIQVHYVHECAHDFSTGPVITIRWNGIVETTTCMCGMSAFHHDLSNSP